MIHPPRLELRHLRYFTTVADELHFGRAAARLALSPPSLSTQIQQLEGIVGARLFERHSRRVTLTDAGRVLLDSAGRIFRDIDVAIAATRQAHAGQSGELRVGFGPTLMLSTLAQVVRAYRLRHPGVHIELRELATAEQIAALLRGDLDLGFVRGAEADPRLHVEPFAREPLLIAVNRDHPLARAARVPVSALADEPWVLFPRAIAPLMHEAVMRLCRSAGFTPRVVQESREVYTTVGLVGAGVGVTIVPATVQRMSWKGVVYKPIARASVQLSMVRASGAVRPVVDAFLTVARSAALRQV
ncbi:MAG TPA: LysR substrate-binding domain-containing protein [Vicinamibacterales bacterium]|nr:LysR substrate-binding domain-containing protein [Vicinamibacterales bacterium]